MEDVGKISTLGNRYRLLKRIGRGGMGEVWLGEDPRLQRQVAIKLLPLRRRDDQEFLVRFEREARAAAALHHPHILPIHDYGQQQSPEADDQTVTYLVMSYVSGGSVEDRLKACAAGKSTLTQDEALNYLLQVAEAIDYAHTHGIIHRDIKPANMLLRDDNWLLLTDFGIARILTDVDASTTGSYLGTPSYMAPEQAQGHAVAASDLYSLAIVAYQLFTGRVPFQADNPYALTFQHAFAAPTSPRVYNPSLSPEFEAALLRGMAKDPAQRPLSATAYTTNLRQALELFPSNPNQQVALVQPQALAPSVTPKPAPRPTRRKVLLGAGIGAGALLVGGGAAAYLVGTRAKQGPVQPTPVSTHPVTPGTGAPLSVASAFTKPVSHMDWSPVKNVLATWSQDDQLVLWDLTSPALNTSPKQLAQTSPENGSSEYVQISWSPDGKMLAASNSGFDLNSSKYETLLYAADLSGTIPGHEPTAILTPETVQGLRWATNDYLVTVTSLKDDITKLSLNIWNIKQPTQKALTLTLKSELAIATNTGINVAAVSPDGSILTISTEQSLLIGRLNTTDKGAPWQQLVSPISLDNSFMGEAAWSADGRYVAAVLYEPSNNGIVGVWDATRQFQPLQPGLSLSSVQARLAHLAWSPTSKTPLLALGGSDGQVYLWNVGSSTTPARTLSGNIQGNITSLAWSYDGHWLAASYDDSAATLLFWRV